MILIKINATTSPIALTPLNKKGIILMDINIIGSNPIK